MWYRRPQVGEVAPGAQGGKGRLMDVTSIISRLRSERQEIDEAILSLERSWNVATIATGLTYAGEKMTCITSGRKPATGPRRLSTAMVKRHG